MKTLQQFLTEEWEHPFSGKELLVKKEEDYAHPVHALVERLRESHHFGAMEQEKYPYRPITGSEYHSHKLNIFNHTLSSSRLNDYLVEKHKGWTQPNAENDEQVARHQATFTKHTAPEDLHVYSGIGFSPRSVAEPHNGVLKVHLPAFTSTSLNHTVAKNFAGDIDKDGYHHIIKIHVPAGSHGAYIGDHSAHSSEREYVIPHGSKLHIHPEPEIHVVKAGPDTAPDDIGNYRVWHAKLVHDSIAPTRHMNEES